MNLFVLIIILVAAGWLLDRILALLDLRRLTENVPEELLEIYGEEKYRTSVRYTRTKLRFGMLSGTWSAMLILAMLFFEGFAFVDTFSLSISNHPVLSTLIFFFILGLASDLLGIPFSLWFTFVIEERFGFNRTTVRLFIADKLKGWLLALILGGAIISLIVWIYGISGYYFWLLAWAVITSFMIFFAIFYTSLIVPLFNKLSPLPDGELRSAIEALSEKTGFKLKNIFVIDGSKRSGKANAYFSGLGPVKKIVLFDTLIQQHTTAELTAILAHEIGHYKKRHIITGLLTSIAGTGVTLWIFQWCMGSELIYEALGSSARSFGIGAVSFGLLYGPVSLVTGIGGNILSRNNEYAADKFACDQGLGKHLQSALIRLSVNNLSNLKPHPLRVFLEYSHPTLLQRLHALDQYAHKENDLPDS